MKKNDPWAKDRAAIRHPKAGPKEVGDALKSTSTFVRGEAAVHPKATAEHIHTALKDSDHVVRMSALDNPNVAKEHLDAAMKDKHPDVRALAVKHPKADIEHVKTAIGDSTAHVRVAAMSHPKWKEAKGIKKTLDQIRTLHKGAKAAAKEYSEEDLLNGKDLADQTKSQIIGDAGAKIRWKGKPRRVAPKSLIEKAAQCSCSMTQLMGGGCKCGAMKADRDEKAGIKPQVPVQAKATAGGPDHKDAFEHHAKRWGFWTKQVQPGSGKFPPKISPAAHQLGEDHFKLAREHWSKWKGKDATTHLGSFAADVLGHAHQPVPPMGSKGDISIWEEHPADRTLATTNLATAAVHANPHLDAFRHHVQHAEYFHDKSREDIANGGTGGKYRTDGFWHEDMAMKHWAKHTGNQIHNGILKSYKAEKDYDRDYRDVEKQHPGPNYKAGGLGPKPPIDVVPHPADQHV